MKTNKSEMIRDAIRAAGEPVTAMYIYRVTGLDLSSVYSLLGQMVARGCVFVAGTGADKSDRKAYRTYELSEFAGEC